MVSKLNERSTTQTNNININAIEKFWKYCGDAQSNYGLIIDKKKK